MTGVEARSTAIELIPAFELDLRHIALYLEHCSEGSRQIGQPREDVVRLLAGRRRRQATCLQEEVIGVLVPSVGLTLANLVLRDRAELDGFEILPLVLDVGDHAFPVDRFVQQNVGRRRLKDKIPEIEKDRPAAINLDTV